VSGHRFNSALMMSRFVLKFQIAKQIDVRGDQLHCPDVAGVGSGADKWLRALAGLTALTDLNLTECREVSNNGLRALAGLTALTSLNLCQTTGARLRVAGTRDKVSDYGLRSLAGLTALTSLDLAWCCQVSDNGLQSLAGLTALAPFTLVAKLCRRTTSERCRTPPYTART
jgi:hypothetical protein